MNLHVSSISGILPRAALLSATVILMSCSSSPAAPAGGEDVDTLDRGSDSTLADRHAGVEAGADLQKELDGATWMDSRELAADLPDLSDLPGDLPDLPGELPDLSGDLPDLVDLVPDVGDATFNPETGPEIVDLTADLPEFSDVVPVEVLFETVNFPDLVDALPDWTGDLDAEFEIPPWKDLAVPTCEADEDCAEFDDADLCNGMIVCLDGLCVFDDSGIPECESLGLQCQENLCIAYLGTCGIKKAEDGLACDDGNPATQLDICLDGECFGTAPASCLVSADCDDAYDCTTDICAAGSCWYMPVVCYADPPDQCSLGVCEHGKGCKTLSYDDNDNKLYEEDFQDGVALGWQTAGDPFDFVIESVSEQGEGVAVPTIPGFSADLLLPMLFLPAALIHISAGGLVVPPELCADVQLEFLQNGEVAHVSSACPFTADEPENVGVQLPPGTSGPAQLGLRISNVGQSPVKLLITSVRVEFQGGFTCCMDEDEDGVLDCLDNCLDFTNPVQEDCDGDGLGDVCDQDADNDGVDSKWDAYPCDPGSTFDCRKSATRSYLPVTPVAIACSQELPGCFLFDEMGHHLFVDVDGKPQREVRFDGLQSARGATMCGERIWVLETGIQVLGYSVPDPSRPILDKTIVIPPNLYSLSQGIACHEGALLISSAKQIYTLPEQGDSQLFYDVMEEVWAFDLAGGLLVAATRSPQPPLRFFVRVLDLEGGETIMALKTTEEEIAPSCIYRDMSFANWGGDGPGGALWTAVSDCFTDRVQLRDPWRFHSGQADLDGDGTPDQTDTDDDGDGIEDLADLWPLDHLTSVDADDDGVGDFLDPDDNGDGTSDNFGALQEVVPLALFDLGDMDAVALAGANGHHYVVDDAGQLFTLDDQGGEVVAPWELPLLSPNALAAAGEHLAVHCAQTRGVARLVDGQPFMWVDAPGQALNLASFYLDIAVDGDDTWVGLGANNMLYNLDPSGNVRLAHRLPAGLRGVAVSADRVFVLLAVNDERGALMVLNRAGSLMGYFALPGDELTKLAASDDGGTVFHSLRTTPEGTREVVRLELPAAFVEHEYDGIEIEDYQLNDAAVAAPFVPNLTGNNSVLVEWPAVEVPVLLDFQVCYICGPLSGYIPQQNCFPAELSAGSFEVEGLTAGKSCAFELRTQGLVGTAASRRVSMTVGEPASGGVVWNKAGTLTAETWRLIRIPGILSMN